MYRQYEVSVFYGKVSRTLVELRGVSTSILEALPGKLDIKRWNRVLPIGLLFKLDYDPIIDFRADSTPSVSFKKCNATFT